ncbi:MAG TPA: CGNR zinc finger domain-containing protein [Thermoleophilaceae bacterium]|nr:CGNR zinc finger domain-containing protein [Thermoleophilaceae bacterium]
MSANRDPAPGDLERVRRFVNTHEFSEGSERIGTREALRDWLEAEGLLAPGAAVSDADVERALAVREALRSLCRAHGNGPADEADLRTLNEAAEDATIRVSFDRDGARLRPVGEGVAAALATLLGIVHEAMRDGTWERMKVCSADDCAWVFYDHSRNRSGAWCTMAVCGNRAKARAYRERRRPA